MRKIIGRRLTESKATVPHYYASVECEIDEVMRFRKQMATDHGIKISVNDIVIRASALALRDVPEANASWDPKSGSVKTDKDRAIDISVAVATPAGLITPIVTDVDGRGLVDINATVLDLATRAKDNKLKPEEFQGGSFTISNLGMFGISEFSAVINPPQACILAVGGGIKSVLPGLKEPGMAVDDKVVPRIATVMTARLSSDRRVVDEPVAGLFLQAFRHYMSQPKLLML